MSNYEHAWNKWKVENLRKEIKDIKKSQKEIFKLKNIITKLKTKNQIQWIGLKTRMKSQRKELVDRTIEII